jgi:YspA, cpYpsA-related SLOG family
MSGTELVYPTTTPVNPIRLLVCGGRDYRDRGRLFGILSALNPAIVIHGAARGADALADEWARSHAVGIKSFPADWALHGKSAGVRRNAIMLHEGHPTLVVAFPGGRGTEDMVRRALLAGVTVLRIKDGDGKRR